jgi:hypothetical protein
MSPAEQIARLATAVDALRGALAIVYNQALKLEQETGVSLLRDRREDVLQRLTSAQKDVQAVRDG